MQATLGSITDNIVILRKEGGSHTYPEIQMKGVSVTMKDKIWSTLTLASILETILLCLKDIKKCKDKLEYLQGKKLSNHI